MKNIIALAILFASFASFASQAAECSVEYFRKINEDLQKTVLQKKNAIENACIGTVRIVTGVVVEVYSKSSIEIKATDGFNYTLKLQTNHNCGDIDNMAKGQKISGKGKVEDVWGIIFSMRLGDSVCIK